MYTLKLEQFEGPLDVLLQLIEKEELDITQVSLAKVTDTFLNYLEKIEDISPDELADFLVVAAKLLLIKSSLLLPGIPVEEEETLNLVGQLKIYREYLIASKKLQKIFSCQKYAFAREKFPKNIKPTFSLTSKITPKILEINFKSIINLVASQMRLARATVRKIISLKEKVNELLKLLKQSQKLSFNNLINQQARNEVVVTFLATLELVREKTITVFQDGLFKEITIKKIIKQ